MAKRLTDSKKWDDDWFLGLSANYKLLWLYMLDKCDHAGFFKPNLKLAGFCLDSALDRDDILKTFGNRIEAVNDKWFIPKYIKFQYGYIKPENNMYKPVYKLLQESGKGDISSFVAPSKGVRREKGKGKGNKKGIGIGLDNKVGNSRVFVVPTVKEVATYCIERKNSINAQKFVDHYTSNGWMVGKNKMKDWKASVRTWEQREDYNDKPRRNDRENTGAIKSEPGKYKGIGTTV